MVFAAVVPYHEGYSIAPNLKTSSRSSSNEYAADSRASLTTSIYGRPQVSKSAELFEEAQQSKVNQRSNSSTGVLTSLRPANNADITRGAIVRIIEESWSKVSMLIPEHTLTLCEEVLEKLFSFQIYGFSE